MVSTRTLLIIGFGIAVAAGLTYIQYQYTTADTLGGQLARSRLGIDEFPPIRSLVNQEADPSKPLSEQRKDRVNQLVDEIIENMSRATGPPPPGGYFVLPKVQTSTSRANAAFYHDLSIEEEKYEPWALGR